MTIIRRAAYAAALYLLAARSGPAQEPTDRETPGLGATRLALETRLQRGERGAHTAESSPGATGGGRGRASRRLPGARERPGAGRARGGGRIYGGRKAVPRAGRARREVDLGRRSAAARDERRPHARSAEPVRRRPVRRAGRAGQYLQHAALHRGLAQHSSDSVYPDANPQEMT